MPQLGFRDVFWPTLGIVCISFHVWLIFAGLVPNLVSRPIHMALALPWVLLWRPKGQQADALSWLVCLAGLIGCAWVALRQNQLSDQYGSLDGPWQTLLAIVLVLSAIDMARRAVGWPLPLIAALMLLYGLFGNYIPGEFGHAGMPLTSFLGTLTITEGGLWGSLTGVSVTIVAIFVIFWSGIERRASRFRVHEHRSGCRGSINRRRRKGVGPLICAVWLYFWLSLSQCRLDRFNYFTGHASLGLSPFASGCR